MNWYLSSFFRAWLLTVLTETLVLAGILKKSRFKEPANLSQLIYAGIFANSLTLPYVWFVFPSLFDGRYSLSLMFSELFAWLVEAVFYKYFLGLPLKKALAISFAANLISFTLGYLVGRIF